MTSSGEVPIGSIECLDEERQLYRVEGRTGTYFVEPDPENPPRWKCSCPAWRFRFQAQGKPCRHQYMVREHCRTLDACPVCRGRAWQIPTAAMVYVTPDGKRDTRPIPCIECNGSGKRSSSAVDRGQAG